MGRHHGEYDAPRNVLQSVLSDEAKVVEMPRNKDQSFCCGAGGGNMWYEVKTGERVNKNRVSQATETDANILAAACNFCNIMLEDGVKTTGNENRIEVKDVAELVAEGLKR